IAVDGFAGVFASVANDGKSIVLPLFNGVDFVAPSRSVLACPQLARPWVDGDALDVSESERINFGVCAGPTDKRIVFRNRSVGIDAQNFSHVAVEGLRLRPVDGVDAKAGRNRGRDAKHAVRRIDID